MISTPQLVSFIKSEAGTENLFPFTFPLHADDRALIVNISSSRTHRRGQLSYISFQISSRDTGGRPAFLSLMAIRRAIHGMTNFKLTEDFHVLHIKAESPTPAAIFADTEGRFIYSLDFEILGEGK